MYKALRTLKINGQMVYLGDNLPENASDFIDVDVFVTKGWIEVAGEVKTKPAVNKTTTGKVDIVDAMPPTNHSKKKKKTKKKISSILSSKTKEPVVESTLEAAVLPKPDMD
tara:strand:+ start:3000 stop:3332 length:333 start_codon:yes stop_codon:yes gene_type:complete